MALSITTRLKLRRAGGSLIATIPAKAVKEGQWEAGAELAVEMKGVAVDWDDFIGSVPELKGFEFDRKKLWGPDRY